MSDGIVLCAGGDVSLGREVTEEVRKRGIAFVFQAMKSVLKKADLFTANWESPVLAEGKQPLEKGQKRRNSR